MKVGGQDLPSCRKRQLEPRGGDGRPDCYWESLADDSFLPTFLLSRLARPHITVALSGDGGDAKADAPYDGPSDALDEGG